MSAPRVTVIGAGIMGAAVAYRLAEAGAEVHIIERDQPGSGTTGCSFARLSAFDKTPHEYFLANHEGMREHAWLATRLASPIWYHPCGSFLWADGASAEALMRRAEQMRVWGYAAQWRDAEEVNRELGVPVRIPESGRVLHAPDEGWVDAETLTRRLLAEATRLAGQLELGESVVGLRQRAAGGWHVALSSRQGFGCDAVVNTAGQAADRVAMLAGSSLNLTPSRGLLMDIGNNGDPIRHILHTPRVSIRPSGRGQVLIRSDEVDRRLVGEHSLVDPALLAVLCEDLLRRAVAEVPALASAVVLRRRVGARVIPRGGYPSVGGIADLPGYYQAVSHSGIILAPLIGRLLAEEIMTGQVHELLAPYRPVVTQTAG